VKRQFPPEDITLYFENSNIHPRSEYLARLKAIKKVSKDQKLELITANWSKNEWLDAINCEEDNRRNKRCKKCWDLRLRKTAKFAQEDGYGYFSTTLIASHYQNKTQITKIAKKYETDDLKFIQVRDIENIETSGFYKQNYCGCIFSLKDKYLEDNSKKPAK
jgi:predicted adenine nucleotide alpha hydrolase (AANH) superfamily ATPase